MGGVAATAVALFSGGLDSILSCRLIQEQGIRVRAVRFVTPFFGYDLLQNQEEYAKAVTEKYGIEVLVRDVSVSYFRILAHPRHGYGRNFNPCVDCKVLLVSEARRLMDELGASFVITGEVLGQRPMSQRRDTLRIVERESGCQGILLRPLCARCLPPTKAELEGMVDRSRLLAFTGRGRSNQIALAERFGITDYPRPAGGCVLTDPILSLRLRRIFSGQQFPQVSDVLLSLTGRQFMLPHGGWLVLGRDETENTRLEALSQPDDLLLVMTEDRPGPFGILRNCTDGDDLQLAARLVVRYGKKIGGITTPPATVVVAGREGGQRLLVPPLEDAVFRSWSV